MYLGEWQVDDVLTFTVTTHTFATGALTDADGNPSYRVYEDETGTAILTGTMAKLDDANTTGYYSEQITLSAANGFEVGKTYSVYITAAVSSVTGGCVRSFQVEAAGATAAALTTVSGLVDDLEGRLTATRAGYLDNLSGGAVALEATAQSVLTDTGTDIPATLSTIAGYVDTEVAAIKAKTDNLPTDPADQSAVEAAITAATSGLATAAALSTVAGYIDTEVASILAAVDTEVAAILEDTGTTLPAQITALNNLSAAQVNAEVVDVLRTDTIPDSYAADGAQPTIAQAVLMMLQFLSERAVSSTTLTVKKPDGSTTAMVFSLDDASNPTSITRAA